jgi:hypothetical protein
MKMFIAVVLLAAIPAFSQTAAPHRIKGLRRTAPNTRQALVKATLRDLRSGAVVVVEEDTIPPLPRWPAPGSLFRMMRPLPPMPGMDPMRVVSNGNTVALLYPLGWDTK